MAKGKKKEERLSISKNKILFELILMWAGAAVSVIGIFFSDATIFGVSLGIIGIPAGIITILGCCLMGFANKCPYCGKRRLGKNIGGKLKTEVRCPDCDKMIDIK